MSQSLSRLAARWRRCVYLAAALFAAGSVPALASPALITGLTGEHDIEFASPPPGTQSTARIDTVSQSVAAEIVPICPSCILVGGPNFFRGSGAGDIRGREVYEAGFAASGGPFSGAIMVIDTAFDQVIGTIATGAFYPTILAVDPVRPQLYAIGRNGTSVQVLVFNTRSRQQAGSLANTGQRALRLHSGCCCDTRWKAVVRSSRTYAHSSHTSGGDASANDNTRFRGQRNRAEP